MSSYVSHTDSATSFRKKGSENVNIPGTRVSTHNAQLLTSTGSSTLDFFIGGGLAVGTMCLIEEDHYNTYSDILVKYFLAEGVVNNHKLWLSSGEKPSKDKLKEVPSMKFSDVKLELQNSASTEKLKIAWRYQNQSGVSTDFRKLCSNHGYDLTKPVPEEMLQDCSVTSWDPAESCVEVSESGESFVAFPYSHLLKKIASEITSNGYRTSSKKFTNIMRIVITSLGSPLWCTNSKTNQELSIIRFLYLLKGLLRSSYAIAVITIPSYVMQNKVFQSRVRQIFDTVINLESFVGSDKRSNPLFKEYHGLLHIVKLPILNTFVYPNQISDLAFKLKMKGFVIERLHLPPDFEESEGEPGSFGCSGQPSKLDF